MEKTQLISWNATDVRILQHTQENTLEKNFVHNAFQSQLLEKLQKRFQNIA